jgi:hypothetical protein
MKLHFIPIANGQANIQLAAENMREEQDLHILRERLKDNHMHGSASITGEHRVQWMEVGATNTRHDRVLL